LAATDGIGWKVERCKEPVSGGVDFKDTEKPDLITNAFVMPLEHLDPSLITQADEAFGMCSVR
jgi:hypothetical protein